MNDDFIIKSTTAYYLSKDVQVWIAQEAKKQNRSESNFLETLLRQIRAKGLP